MDAARGNQGAGMSADTTAVKLTLRAQGISRAFRLCSVTFAKNRRVYDSSIQKIPPRDTRPDRMMSKI